MSNLVFPTLSDIPGLSWDRVKTPMWSTGIQTAASGYELRTAYFAYPIWKFEFSYDLLREQGNYAELKKILGFYNNHRGQWDSWLYSDPDDSPVTLESFGTGNGSTLAFQLVRNVSTWQEPVKNLNGAPSIYKNGVLQTSGYTVSSTGMVNFATAPANGAALTWSGAFYYRCRFQSDEVDFNEFAYRLWNNRKLAFQTIKQL